MFEFNFKGINYQNSRFKQITKKFNAENKESQFQPPSS